MVCPAELATSPIRLRIVWAADSVMVVSLSTPFELVPATNVEMAALKSKRPGHSNWLGTTLS
jgi:hypothetical protein